MDINWLLLLLLPLNKLRVWILFVRVGVLAPNDMYLLQWKKLPYMPDLLLAMSILSGFERRVEELQSILP